MSTAFFSLDIIFVVVEIAFTIYLHTHVDQNYPGMIDFLQIVWHIILVLLACLLVIRLLDLGIIVKRRGLTRSLIERYDIAWPIRTPSRHSKTKNEELSGVSILLGGWKPHFPGEARWIIHSRGLFSITLIFALLLYAVSNVVIEPLQENGAILTRERRAGSLMKFLRYQHEHEITSSPASTIVVARRPPFGALSSTSSRYNLSDSVTVEPLWRKIDGFISQSPCIVQEPSTQRLSDTNLPVADTVSLSCVPSQNPYPSHNLTPDRKSQLSYQIILTDLLVTVNFTRLGISIDKQEYTTLDSVQVYLGLTDRVDDAVRKSAPTTLVPGVNLIGMVQVVMRREFVSPSLSTFGIFGSYRTYYTADMVHVWPDPRPLKSNPSQNSPEIGTLRIAFQNDFSDWKIIEDYRDKSVLSGFASIGGLWAFIAGVFTAMYGTSILKTLFGFKPLSFIGLAHWFQRNSLRDACTAEYPLLQQDLQTPLLERGLLSFFYDHLLDVGFLAPSKKETAYATEDHELL
ncbi:hypothetical protein CPB83DRAFT_69023 [Crepidotus variabilis]|uniref:Uncharacterized protein n=1 Tax=Crepidotus variabilis TaxID=179855 RepID=A0A9P6E5K5_9AGAR|nr:hypothetical protein CPB83DRAFT_69023 [Crepidotus variabilis]